MLHSTTPALIYNGY